MDIKGDKMKKELRVSIYFILALILSSSLIYAQSDIQKKIIVLDKGVKRYIYVFKKENNQSNKFSRYSEEQLISKKGIIVKFKNPIDSASDFEQKYGLKLKHKMQTGYYIFDNISENSDVEIVSQIIANEKNILTVKPNWKGRNIPR